MTRYPVPGVGFPLLPRRQLHQVLPQRGSRSSMSRIAGTEVASGPLYAVCRTDLLLPVMSYCRYTIPIFSPHFRCSRFSWVPHPSASPPTFLRTPAAADVLGEACWGQGGQARRARLSFSNNGFPALNDPPSDSSVLGLLLSVRCMHALTQELPLNPFQPLLAGQFRLF